MAKEKWFGQKEGLPSPEQRRKELADAYREQDKCDQCAIDRIVWESLFSHLVF